MGSTCTAHIKIKEVAGELKILYCSTHFGHQMDPGHLNMTKDEKDFIASK